MSKKENEEELLEAIKQKLSECPNLSYKKIAVAAEQVGRKQIALSLLKNEDSIKDQIPILLTMEQYAPALSIALANCEADIVYGIISEMKNAGVPIIKIVEHCSQVEGCISYLLSYAHERIRINPDDKMLRDIYNHSTSDSEIGKKLYYAGILDVNEYQMFANAIHNETYHDTKDKLQQIVLAGKNNYMKIKPYADNYLNFLEFKAANLSLMRTKGAMSVEGFALAEPLFKSILELGAKREHSAVIEAMAKKLKIEPKYVMMLRLRALAKVNDWVSFNDIAKKEKPRLPAQYYARTCIEFGNKELAVSFIAAVPIIEEKIDLFMDIEYFLL